MKLMPMPSRRAGHLTRFSMSCLALCVVASSIGGCRSSQTVEPTMTSKSGVSPRIQDMTLDEAAQYAEDRYVVGPRAADSAGYRIDWQRSPSTDVVEHFEFGGDSVFALDSHNFLARVRASDGVRIWRVPIVEAVEEVYGLAFVPAIDRVYVVTGSALIELDGATGNQLSKQKFEKVASTAPVVFDEFVLYGARNGQLVWHSFRAQYQWKSYQVAPSVLVKPVIDMPYVICCGTDGRLMVLHVSTVTQMWNTQLLGEIVAAPAAANGIVYVSSLDQHLRAYDIETGRKLWAVLTDAELVSSPVVIADRVYQEIPADGLACLEAAPFDSPGGVEIWRSKGAYGRVITQRNNDLVVWDANTRTVRLVDGKFGAIVRTIELPKVKQLYASSDVEGVLYAIADDGTILRLVPRGS